MMPNERAGRGGAVRGALVGLVGIVLVVVAAMTWGPFAPSAATVDPSSSVAVVGPGGSPSPGATASTGSGGPSGPSSAPPSAGTAAPSSSPLPSGTPEPAAVAAKLQRSLDALRAKLQVPGVSVAIVWDDGRTWLGASGLRNVAAKDPMTTDTAFAFASISKTFTAAVVMQLVEEGKIGLDQSVAPLLPQFGLDRRITVRMLLDHTSGLPDFFMGKGIDAALRRSPSATWTALQSWGYVSKPHATPGKSWTYSNTNYLLLGELVTALTGQPLADEVRTRLLNPLGLTGAYYQGVEQPKEVGTIAYSLSLTAGGKWLARAVAPLTDVIPFRSVVTAAAGAGSIAGTALDAARWMQAWAGGRVLSPATQALVLADVARTVKLHATIPYGLGIQRVVLNGYTALGHSGRYLGIQNVVRYLPQLGVTIAVLTNQSIWNPNRFASALLKVIAPASPAASASPSAPPSGSQLAPGLPSPSPSG